MLFVLLLACGEADTSTPCPETPCQDEVIFSMEGPNGPTVAAGTILPADSAMVTFDCRELSGEGWRCDRDGTLHVYTRAASLTVDAYSTDANAHAYAQLSIDWHAGGTSTCPSGCETAAATVTFEAFDTGCFDADGDTGGGC